MLIDRNEIGPVGRNPGSDEHSDNIQITGNGPNLRITNNWIHHQGYYEGSPTANAGSTYIHGGDTASLLYENNLIETAQGRTEICGLGTGGTSRSNITIRRNTWVDGGLAFNSFPGFEWDCDSGSGNMVERNIAVDPTAASTTGGSPGAATFSTTSGGSPRWSPWIRTATAPRPTATRPARSRSATASPPGSAGSQHRRRLAAPSVGQLRRRRRRRTSPP